MKIIQLTAENIKKLRAIEITPTGEIVTIAGKNGAGKTSVLDSIWWLLAGKKNIQAQPIRRGETSAKIKAQLGGQAVELIAERTFTKKGDDEYTSSLTVTTAEGFTPPGGPQAVLDALLGDLSFDPFAFARSEPSKQFEELRRVSKLDIDIVSIDQLNAADYTKRTNVNRDAKAKRAQAAAVIVRADLPFETIDENAMLDEIEKAADQNAQIEQRKARRIEAVSRIERSIKEAERCEQNAAESRREAETSDENAAAHRHEAAETQRKLDEAAPLPEVVDISGIRRKLDEAREINAAISSRTKRKAIEAEAEALEKQAKQITETMDSRENTKRAAIMSAKLPVAGLGFGDGVVTFNEVPFDQASTAEQLRVSLAIAMAANPKLRVIRIQDGSLLDDDSLSQIATMAKEHDYQVWIERVETDGSAAILIEDGAVKVSATE